MTAVGIRSLKANLSAYIRQVHADRLPIAVTDRGQVVAWLTPPAAEPAAPPSLAERMRARGGVVASTSDWSESIPELRGAAHDADVQALLAELRGES